MEWLRNAFSSDTPNPNSGIGSSEDQPQTETDMPKYSMEGWAIVTLHDWASVVDVPEANQPKVGTLRKGKAVLRRTVAGYAVPVNRGDLGIELGGGHHARWALFVYHSPHDDTPFFIVPGCQVKAVQVYDAPLGTGFLDVDYEKDSEIKELAEKVERLNSDVRDLAVIALSLGKVDDLMDGLGTKD